MTELLQAAQDMHVDLSRQIAPLTDPLYEPLRVLGGILNQDLGNMIYLACMVYSLILCLILGQIRVVWARKLFSSSAGLFLGFYFYGLLYFLNIAWVLLCYLSLAVLPRKLGSNVMFMIALVGMLTVTTYHWYFSNKVGQHDLDLIFMMNFIKLHMMAVNYENAGKLKSKDEKVRLTLTAREVKFAEPFESLISFSDFFHYMFFCASSWTGMSHDYLHFVEFINLKGGYS